MKTWQEHKYKPPADKQDDTLPGMFPDWPTAIFYLACGFTIWSVFIWLVIKTLIWAFG